MGETLERPVRKGEEPHRAAGCRGRQGPGPCTHLTDGAVEAWGWAQLYSSQLKLSALFSGSASGQGAPPKPQQGFQVAQ